MFDSVFHAWTVVQSRQSIFGWSYGIIDIYFSSFGKIDLSFPFSQKHCKYLFFSIISHDYWMVFYWRRFQQGNLIIIHIINAPSIACPIIKMSKITASFCLVALSLFLLANSTTVTLPSSFSVPVIATVQAGYSVTYSSLFVNPDCWMFYLNHPFSAWSAYVADTSQWVQVSSTKNEVWVAVITQGRPNFDQWVTEYQVSYTLDGVSWTYVDKAKLFTGNSNRNTQVRNFFSRGIYARAIRISPTKWNNFLSMRFEALIIDS